MRQADRGRREALAIAVAAAAATNAAATVAATVMHNESVSNCGDTNWKGTVATMVSEHHRIYKLHISLL